MRALLSAGSLLGAAVLLSAAVLVDVVDVTAVGRPGAGHVFDLQVAGSDEPGWTPSASDWAQGNPVAHPIGAADADPLALPPGGTRVFALAVRNASPELASALRVSIVDADATGDGSSLFRALRFSLVDGDGRVVLDGAPGVSGVVEGDWAAGLAPGAELSLELRVHLPASVGNELMGAQARPAVRFDGSSR